MACMILVNAEMLSTHLPTFEDYDIGEWVKVHLVNDTRTATSNGSRKLQQRKRISNQVESNIHPEKTSLPTELAEALHVSTKTPVKDLELQIRCVNVKNRRLRC
jgi:hypothetical protein